jgi:hypothetical protein
MGEFTPGTFKGNKKRIGSVFEFDIETVGGTIASIFLNGDKLLLIYYVIPKPKKATWGWN